MSFLRAALTWKRSLRATVWSGGWVMGHQAVSDRASKRGNNPRWILQALRSSYEPVVVSKRVLHTVTLLPSSFLQENIRSMKRFRIDVIKVSREYCVVDCVLTQLQQ